MTRLGLGLAAIGRPAYINLGHETDFPGGREVQDLRTQCHRLLDLAWDRGVRHFDAARSYGLAEEFLGDWLLLHPGRRSELTIGSKWGYTYVGGWRLEARTHEVKDHSLASFQRQWPETLSAIGGPPDLYLIHSLTPENTALGDRPLLDALAELAATGVRVGFSTSGPQQAQVIRAALALGASGPFRAVQSTWNLFEQSAGPALTELLAAGWHVTFKETVANGRLTERGIGQPRLETPRHGSRPPDPRGSAELSSTGGVDTILRVAQAHGCSVDVVALAAALAQPATIALMGATTRSQLTSNLEASELDLTVDELAALATTAEDPAAYWRHRATLPWV